MRNLDFLLFLCSLLGAVTVLVSCLLIILAIVMLPYFKRLNIFNAKIHIMDERYKEIVEN